jgi:ABC-2 type transport system ATP-binding protein
MIEANNLTKILGEESVLRGLSFSVRPGQICGFLGRNGAGKTTTLRILCGLLQADSGSIRIAGLQPQGDGKNFRRNIGYLPEEPQLYPDLSVKEQLQFVARLYGLTRSERRFRCDQLLSRCGLESHANFLCSQLSKGFRQRLGFAQALVHDPLVLILDEPTNGLDPSQILEFRTLVRDCSLKKTVLLSTHLLHEVRQLCDSVVLLEGGRSALHSSIQSLPAHADLENLFDSTPEMQVNFRRAIGEGA